VLPLLAVSCLVITGCGKKGGDEAAGGDKPGAQAAEAVPVDVTPVTVGTIAQTIPITGNLAALQDVQLSAKQAGRVISVAAREGDPVRAGQLIVQQDTSDLVANLRQAQANVLSAQAKVSQAFTSYQIQVTQAKQGVLNAQATLRQAQQTYLKTQRGSRPQEVLQSESSVLSAKANLDNAATNLKRQQTLYQQGAVAKADLDTAQTTYDVDLAQYKNAQAALSLTKEGNRQEDIAGALEQVRQQQTNLKNAIANQKLIASKRDDIVAAQAAVAQMKAVVTYDQVQIQNASIYSPISGIVASRSIDPGQIAAVNANLIRVVNLNTVYYQPTISETDITQTGVGKVVNVQADAIPGKTYTGKVVAVYPAANAADRNFSLRVNVVNSDQALRPGMFARGSVITKSAKNVPVIPATALIPDSAGSGFTSNTSSNEAITQGTLMPPSHVVVVGPNNRAQMRKVQVGIADVNNVQILSGLKPGDRVITRGQQALKDGDQVAVQNNNSSATAKISKADL